MNAFKLTDYGSMLPAELYNLVVGHFRNSSNPNLYYCTIADDDKQNGYSAKNLEVIFVSSPDLAKNVIIYIELLECILVNSFKVIHVCQNYPVKNLDQYINNLVTGTNFLDNKNTVTPVFMVKVLYRLRKIAKEYEAQLSDEFAEWISSQRPDKIEGNKIKELIEIIDYGLTIIQTYM